MEHRKAYPALYATHSFRRSLPHTACYVESDQETGHQSGDTRLFVMSFIACFLAVSAFIA